MLYPTIDEEHLPNFHQVCESLYRGGQPSAQGFTQLQKMGVRTIINLRDDCNVKRAEESVRAAGLNFISIPLSPFMRPSEKNINQFLEVLMQEPHQPHFVHCLHGMDRTGCMISIYRMHAHDWPLEQAYIEALEHGFHPEFDQLKKAAHEFGRLQFMLKNSANIPA